MDKEQPEPEAAPHERAPEDLVRATNPPPVNKEPRPHDYPNLGGEVD